MINCTKATSFAIVYLLVYIDPSIKNFLIDLFYLFIHLEYNKKNKNLHYIILFLIKYFIN
jgi:hypothetical protein